MTWPIPSYSKKQINEAGRILVDSENSEIIPIDDEKSQWALEVLNNWRSCHGYPINTFQATLRSKLKSIDHNAIVAQRLKRMPSIIGKLQRFDKMQLSRMQDIGGLRAVVSTLDEVRQLEANYQNSTFNHELLRSLDYIEEPKESGYRSVHLVYRYKNSRRQAYDGLCLELQIRTRLQHAWATAVETVGTFLRHALKSSEGPKDWLSFFSLTGSAFAHLEATPPVPKYAGLSKKETFVTVVEQARQLGVKDKLVAYSIAAERVHMDQKKGMYHLVVLSPEQQTVSITNYGRDSLDAASRDYGEVEHSIAKGEPIQAVLVSAGPIESLRRAYPNLFLDTHEFVEHLNRIEAEALF